MFKLTHFFPWIASAAALLALLAVVLCARLSHPWTYNDDYNGAFWAQAARNLGENGILATAGVPAPLYFGRPPVPREALYVHHPTLLPEMMFVDRGLLGESESAARALPVLFSLLTAALLWRFAFLCAGPRGAALVLALFVAAPMELHYGQMVNFEAPELFFLLAALVCFHLWRWRPSTAKAAALLICCALAMETDWQGYLLVILLAAQSLIEGRGRASWLWAWLLLAALLSGLAFLVQIHLALPGSWKELWHAFLERSGHGNLAGAAFTNGEWLRTEFTYLTTLFHPVAWILAIIGAVIAVTGRSRLSIRERALMHTGAVLFLIDAFYVCALRNQSYIHDFAGFYFLAPVAIFAAWAIELAMRAIVVRWPGYPAQGATLLACSAAAALIWSGIGRLDGIDTQFCILDDDDSEPGTLMPDLGRLIDRAFPADSVIICNFDPYYSPLPYYARRTMVNNVRTYAGWQSAISDAQPQAAGGIIWTNAPDSPDLLRQLSPADIRPVKVDGIPFVLWQPKKS